MLTNKQRNVINDMVFTTKTMVQISKDNDISRVSIYKWLNKDEEFNTELDKKLKQQEKWVTQQFKKNIQVAHDEVLKIVKKADSEKTRLDAAKYYIDRSLGVPTAKINMNSNVEIGSKLKDQDILDAFENVEDK